MNAVEFIEREIRRGSSLRPKAVGLAIGAALLCSMGLGLGLRESLDGAFLPRIFYPNLASALLLALALALVFWRRLSSRASMGAAAAMLSLALFLAGERIFFPEGARTTYPSPAAFFWESARCFGKGFLAATLLGLSLAYGTFRLASLPSRAWRLFFSGAGGVSAAVMLGFHCDSSSLLHVALGHILPGLCLGALLFLFLEILAKRRLGAAFPVLRARLRNFENIS